MSYILKIILASVLEIRNELDFCMMVVMVVIISVCEKGTYVEFKTFFTENILPRVASLGLEKSLVVYLGRVSGVNAPVAWSVTRLCGRFL